MRRLAPLAAAAALVQGCSAAETRPLLPDGCYYSSQGIPVLQVSGREGQILVRTDIRRVRLDARRGWTGPSVEVDPAFNLDTASADRPPEVWAVAFRPPRPWTFDIRESEGSPILFVPLLAASHEELRLGPPCPEAVRRAG